MLNEKQIANPDAAADMDASMLAYAGTPCILHGPNVVKEGKFSKFKDFLVPVGNRWPGGYPGIIEDDQLELAKQGRPTGFAALAEFADNHEKDDEVRHSAMAMARDMYLSRNHVLPLYLIPITAASTRYQQAFPVLVACFVKRWADENDPAIEIADRVLARMGSEPLTSTHDTVDAVTLMHWWTKYRRPLAPMGAEDSYLPLTKAITNVKYMATVTMDHLWIEGMKISALLRDILDGRMRGEVNRIGEIVDECISYMKMTTCVPELDGKYDFLEQVGFATYMTLISIRDQYLKANGSEDREEWLDAQYGNIPRAGEREARVSLVKLISTYGVRDFAVSTATLTDPNRERFLALGNRKQVEFMNPLNEEWCRYVEERTTMFGDGYIDVSKVGPATQEFFDGYNYACKSIHTLHSEISAAAAISVKQALEQMA